MINIMKTEINEINLADFLAAFYPDKDEPIYLRGIQAKGSTESYTQSYKATWDLLQTNTRIAETLTKENENRGIYFVVNAGGNKDEEITRYNAFFAENDEISIEEQHKALNGAPIQPSIRIETKKSVHAYWLIDGDCLEEDWRNIQARLIEYFKGDKSIKNPSRTMRLPFFNHVSFSKETEQISYKKVKLVEFNAENRFTVQQMKEAFPAPEPSQRNKSVEDRDDVTSCDNVTRDCKSQEYKTWTELNSELGMRIMQQGKRNATNKYEMRCPVHQGESETSLFFDPQTKAIKCMAECQHEEILKAFGLPTEPKKESKVSQSALLVNLTSGAEFFVSQNDEPFASFEVNGHIETWAVESKNFKDWLGRKYYQKYAQVASEKAVNEALSTLCGRSKFDGERKHVFVRRAEHEGAIYLDLVNDDWQVVKITTEGWEITSNYPIKFRRTRGMKSLPIPIKGGSLNELDRFLNIYNDDLKLVKAWLITTLKNDIPYPILVFSSQQNCGKSTSASVLCEMVDPHQAKLVSKPRSEEDLFISVSNRMLIAFDNLSYITDEFSDSLCRIATGGAFTKRKSYTDTDETILIAKNPLILTGIGDIATKGDLLSRSIIIHLQTIAERVSETNFWEEFKETQPRILGALLDAASVGLRKIYFVEIENCEARMLDFVKFGTAIEEVIGLKKGEFVRLCNTNYENANNIAIENNPVALLINQLMQSRVEWLGNSTELLTELFVLADEMTRKNPSFPRSPQKLSNILDRLAPSFELEGMIIDKGPHLREAGTGKRRIKITKLDCDLSQSSQLSQNRLEKEKQASLFI